MLGSLLTLHPLIHSSWQPGGEVLLIPPDKETGSERVGSLPKVTQQSWDSHQTLKLSPMPLASCCVASSLLWTKSQLKARIRDLGQNEGRLRSMKSPPRMCKAIG